MSRALLNYLQSLAQHLHYHCRVKWRKDTLIVWDNRSTMHCALPFDEDRYRRMMYRVQVAGDEPH